MSKYTQVVGSSDFCVNCHNYTHSRLVIEYIEILSNEDVIISILFLSLSVPIELWRCYLSKLALTYALGANI